MIELRRGNLLDADTEALVNTVNCVGIMGKGIALDFKKKFPGNFKAYEHACETGQVLPGRMFVVPTGTLWNPRYIINFPTKRHWKSSSRLEDIQSGLTALVEEVAALEIRSIAVPPLGCGHGGLDWHVVRPLIVKAFTVSPEVKVFLYEPEASTPAVASSTAKMTAGRAKLLTLMTDRQDANHPFCVSDVHLLTYILQRSGQPLRLQFEWGASGPWAPALERVLVDMEGSFIGYDRHRGALWLRPEAITAATEFLWCHSAARAHLETIRDLLRGLRGQRDLALIGRLLWAAEKDANVAQVPQVVIDSLAAIAEDGESYSPQEIRRTWDRLYEAGWLFHSPG